MNKNDLACHPIYFPTKVAIVDDDIDYLSHLGLLLDDRLTYDLFTSPSEALYKIRSRESGNQSLAASCFHSLAQVESAKTAGWSIDLRRIHGLVHNAQRFSHFTVLIVDYAMPEMNGIELCRRLAGVPIKKILLTGKADSAVAVEAFNQGLIDQYIRKEDVNIASVLNQVVQRMIDRFFAEACVVPNPALSAEAPYLFDQIFIDWFANIRAQQNVVEYYLWGWHLLGGYVMVTENGEVKLLMVQTPEHAMAHYEIARDDNISLVTLTKIGKREVIPMIGADGLAWHQRLYPALEIGNYRCVIVKAQEVEGFDTPPNVGYSYRQYLEDCNK
ncbi:MAG: response regulator [Gammaproteobacteria bacterium]|nr:response regulator [Gammaproteobacteria bacterium]